MVILKEKMKMPPYGNAVILADSFAFQLVADGGCPGNMRRAEVSPNKDSHKHRNQSDDTILLFLRSDD